MPLQPLSALSAKAGFAPPREAHWRPGLGGACHSEVFARSGEAAGTAAALALALDDCRSQPRQATAEAEDRRAVLWVQTREAARLTGRPYRPGLPAMLRDRIVHVLAPRPEDALFALEEGVRCRDVAFVLGEVTGNPRALDFTASRRLTLAAERHGVALYLVRLDGARDLSSARMRWEVRAAPSAPPLWNPEAPGAPAWHAELFRARGHAPGAWVLSGEGGRLAANTKSVRPEEPPSLSSRRLEGQAASSDFASGPSRQALGFAPRAALLDPSSGRTEILLGA
jgi:protein ImuA